MIEVCDVGFKISKDKYYILSPKHYIVASQVVDKQQEVNKVIRQCELLDLSDWQGMQPYDQYLEIEADLPGALLKLVEID